MNIIRKVLRENRKAWHVHLKYALWENRIGTKKSIGMSPFQMVYGTDVVLPINLSLPVINLWHDTNEDPNDVLRRIKQIIEVQQNRAEVDVRLQKYQDNMKSLFDKKEKDREFFPGDLVLKWDVRKEDPGKHDKFDHLWFGPLRISSTEGKNSFLPENLDGKFFDTPINGCYIKHFMQ